MDESDEIHGVGEDNDGDIHGDSVQDTEDDKVVTRELFVMIPLLRLGKESESSERGELKSDGDGICGHESAVDTEVEVTLSKFLAKLALRSSFGDLHV